MALNWTTADEQSSSAGVKICVYGDSGNGKTSLIATLPTPVVISAERGMLSLRKSNIERIHGVGTPGIAYHIPALQVSSLAEFEEAIVWLKTSPEADQFGSIAVDSVSELAEVILEREKITANDNRQAYMKMMDLVYEKVRELRDIEGKHVLVIAKEEFTKDFDGVQRYGPSLPGTKLSNQMPYFFDMMFAMRIGKDGQGQQFRYLQTQPCLQYRAKDRSGALEPMEYPHLGAVIDKILADQQPIAEVVT